MSAGIGSFIRRRGFIIRDLPSRAISHGGEGARLALCAEGRKAMSTRVENGVKYYSTLIGLVVAVFGAVQAFALLPYKVQQNQDAVRAVSEEGRMNREILVRIDERTKMLEETLKRLEGARK